jgi:hypothetical protein
MSIDPNGAGRKSPFRPPITAQISLGNLITIVGVIIAAATGYTNLDNRVANNAEALAQNARAVQSVRALSERQQDRLRATEIAVTRQDERTSSIMTALGRIEGQLQRLDERLNGRTGR